MTDLEKNKRIAQDLANSRREPVYYWYSGVAAKSVSHAYDLGFAPKLVYPKRSGGAA